MSRFAAFVQESPRHFHCRSRPRRQTTATSWYQVRKDGDTIHVAVDCPVRAFADGRMGSARPITKMPKFITNVTESTVRMHMGNRLHVIQKGKASRGPLSIAFENMREIQLVPQSEIRSKVIAGDTMPASFVTRIEERSGVTHVVHTGNDTLSMGATGIGLALIEGRREAIRTRYVAENPESAAGTLGQVRRRCRNRARRSCSVSAPTSSRSEGPRGISRRPLSRVLRTRKRRSGAAPEALERGSGATGRFACGEPAAAVRDAAPANGRATSALGSAIRQRPKGSVRRRPARRRSTTLVRQALWNCVRRTYDRVRPASRSVANAEVATALGRAFERDGKHPSSRLDASAHRRLRARGIPDRLSLLSQVDDRRFFEYWSDERTARSGRDAGGQGLTALERQRRSAATGANVCRCTAHGP